MDFDAFLSYAHGVDVDLARLVQEALQRLGKPWYRRRALRVFRDETGLSANPGLWSSITDAMARSDCFVLLASPDAADSAWVNREVSHWFGHGDSSRLLVAVVDGSWEWDEATGDFTDGSTAVPDALRGVFVEEPRHIDLRWARNETGLSVRTPRFRDQMAELAAPIHGVTKDELVGNDLREHRRTIRTARAAVAVLVVLSIIATLSAITAARNADRARSNQARAERARAESDYQRLVAQSENSAGRDSSLALLLGVEANNLRDEPASRSPILRALQGEGLPLDVNNIGRGVREADLVSDHLLVYSTRDGRVGFHDLLTRTPVGKPLALGRRRTLTSFVDIAADSTRGPGDPIVVGRRDTGQVWQIDPATRTLVGQPLDTGGPIFDVAASQRLGLVAVAHTDGTVDLWRWGETAPVRTLPTTTAVAVDLFTPGDPAAAARRYGTGNEPLQPGDPSAVAFNPVTDQLAVERAGGLVELWAIDPVGGPVGGPVTSMVKNQSGYLKYLPGNAQLSYSPDGRLLLVTEALALDTLTALDTIDGAALWAVTSLGGFLGTAFSADSTTFFTTASGGIDERDPGTGGPRRNLTHADARDAVRLIATADGQIIRVEGSGRTPTWSLNGRGAIVTEIPGGDVGDIFVSPDGARLVVARGPGPFFDNEIWTINPPRLEIPHVLTGRADFLSDDVLVAFYSDLTAGRFDLRTVQRIRPDLPFDPLKFTYVHVNGAAGLVAVSYSDGSVDVFDKDANRRSVRVDGVPTGVETTADGRLLVLVNSILRSYDLRTGRPNSEPIRNVNQFHVVPDGRVVVTFTDQSVRVVDLTAGKVEPGPLFGQSSVAFVNSSIRGDKAAFQTDQGTTRLVDIDTRTQLGADFNTRGALLRGLQLSPAADRLILTTSTSIEIWDLRPASWRSAACRTAGRNLTLAEWRSYMPDGSQHRKTCELWPLVR